MFENFAEQTVRKPRMACFPEGIPSGKQTSKKSKRTEDAEQIFEAFSKAVAPRDVCQSDVRFVLFQLPNSTVAYNWFRSSCTIADLWTWLEVMANGAYTRQIYAFFDQDMLRSKHSVKANPLPLNMTLSEVIAQGKEHVSGKSDIRLSLRVAKL